MAEEFGQDQSVIGWQLDNEVYTNGPRGCCCPVCHRKFQDLLRARYGTVQALNDAWCLGLWSMDYQSFAQIPVPRSDTWHHPSLLTAWMSFQGDSYVEFCHEQADILHRLTRQPVGTDMMPTYGVNYHKMHRKLEVVQFNHYNSMDNLWQACFWMDLCRPLKAAPFWNTETATCWNGSVAANGYREPGFCRANSWLPFALGGEANLYWLWRAHWAGQELMHGSVVSSAGRPLHVFGEVKEIAAGLRAAATFLNNTRPVRSGLALHLSNNAWWTFEFQPMVNKFNYREALLNGAYRPMLQAHLRPDVIDPAANLKPYKVVFSPFLPFLDEEGLRDRVKAWIQAGGTWVVGPMSDVRNADAAKFTQAPYGVLEEWAGVRCAYEIPGDPRQFAMKWSDGNESIGAYWYDALELHGATALATYTEGPMTGLAAVARKKMGKGQIVVLGTLPVAGALQRLMLKLCADAGVRPAAEASPNLLVVPREGKAARGMVVVELQNQPASIELPQPATDLLTKKKHTGKVDVPPYGVMVLKD
jgi:beta-galactosidase GanA